MSLTISVVSHGHGAELLDVLDALARPGAAPVHRVWVTLNVPEPGVQAQLNSSQASHRWPFDLQLIANPQPQGFGANHNRAFAREQAQPGAAQFFAVFNPDMQWQTDPLPALVAAARQPEAGCAYPLQLSPDGAEQDHRRSLPSPRALWHRHAQRTGRPQPWAAHPIDWVNAACLVFPSRVYAEMGGFDEGYFMYCEDVDICLRLQLAGYRLVEAPSAQVIHHAHRSSRRNLRHLWWHVRSLWRLWRSDAYQRYQRSRHAA